MSAQHTPGPLSAVRATQGGDYAVKDRDNNIVAECFEDIREQGESAIEEAKANATLYAAAPELLEALTTLRAVARSMEAERDSEKPTEDEYQAALVAADAAIAKAVQQ